MTTPYPTLERQALDDTHAVWSGRLPNELVPDDDAFEGLWNLHPEEYHLIHIHGRQVRTPRWQQAYGADYHYTGQTNRALALTPQMEPLLDWAREHVDPRLNGLLFNWYDGQKGHYIGRHRDSTTNMIPGTPIVTLSMGQERIFRMRPWKQKNVRLDFTVDHGSVLVVPYDTNQSWTHEVPAFKRWTQRRISITLRGFENAA